MDQLDMIAPTSGAGAQIDAKSLRKEIVEKYNWEADNCYVQEPLACNSDDERCIRQAVRGRKVLKAESKKLMVTFQI